MTFIIRPLWAATHHDKIVSGRTNISVTKSRLRFSHRLQRRNIYEAHEWVSIFILHKQFMSISAVKYLATRWNYQRKLTLNALRNAVKIFIVIAWALAALAFLMQVAKWLSSWLRCFCAICGNTWPNNLIEASMTATPRGRGPGDSID